MFQEHYPEFYLVLYDDSWWRDLMRKREYLVPNTLPQLFPVPECRGKNPPYQLRYMGTPYMTTDISFAPKK